MFRREEEATIYVWIISSRNLTKNKKIISAFSTENVRVTYTGKDIQILLNVDWVSEFLHGLGL
jgi:hypothetical protein